MKIIAFHIKFHSVAILLAALLFSCTNDIKKVRNFLSDKNLPIGKAQNIHTLYKDSGKVVSILDSPLMYDYANRELQPYMEFPEGIRLLRIYGDSDSTLVTARYALTYTKNDLSELRDSVEVINYSKNFILRTSQLFWDQKLHYFISTQPFILVTPSDTIYGQGFESTENLENWQSRNNYGSLTVKE